MRQSRCAVEGQQDLERLVKGYTFGVASLIHPMLKVDPVPRDDGGLSSIYRIWVRHLLAAPKRGASSSEWCAAVFVQLPMLERDIRVRIDRALLLLHAEASKQVDTYGSLFYTSPHTVTV